jgi:hypothetical protein
LFEGWTKLESCLIAGNSTLVSIGAQTFAKRASLRSFSIPPLIREIGGNSFDQCIHLYRLNFQSSESLMRVLGDRSLEHALEELGVRTNSGLFSIEVGDGEMDLKLVKSISVHAVDENLQLSLVRDPQ